VGLLRIELRVSLLMRKVLLVQFKLKARWLVKVEPLPIATVITTLPLPFHWRNLGNYHVTREHDAWFEIGLAVFH
jgi:hypothetical protein